MPRRALAHSLLTMSFHEREPMGRKRSDLMQVSDKVALVTGAGSGIGRAAALQLAREGARVVALGRTDSELRQVVAEIKDAGGQALAVVADVADAGQVRRAVEQA